MEKSIVELRSINKLEDVYTLDNVDAYLLANRQFSYRFVESFCINKINKVRKYAHDNNKKVYVLVNKIFKDDDLEKLEVFLTKLKKANVDGIFFTDFAVFVLAEKLEMADKCIFYHETFLRNTYDILTYQESGIKKIICSKDMHLKDIKLLPKENKDSYGIICFGYIPLYESQRKILTHYISMNKLPKSLLLSIFPSVNCIKQCAQENGQPLLILITYLSLPFDFAYFSIGTSSFLDIPQSSFFINFPFKVLTNSPSFNIYAPEILFSKTPISSFLS